MLKRSDLEELGKQEVRQRLARGDYAESSERSFVEDWLRFKDEEREYDEECTRATRSSAFDTRRLASEANRLAKKANTIAAIALAIATISIILTIVSFVIK